MSKHQQFDLLVCTNILLYSHHSDWFISKPYLISSNFNQAFKTREFSKQYYINLLQLNQEETDKLSSLLKSNKKKRKQQKKKIKLENDEEDNSIKLSNFKDILQFYIKNSKNNINIIKNYISQYEINNKTSLMDKIINISTIEKVNKTLKKEFKNFTKKERYGFTKDNIKELFGKFKGIFVKKYEEKKYEEETEYIIEYTVFSGCGFPLIIESHYSHELDTYRSNHTRSEQVIINSKELFYHGIYYNEQGHFPTEREGRFDEKLLKQVKEILFFTNDTTLYLEKNLNTILYDWLEIGLLEHSGDILESRGGISGGFPTIHNNSEDENEDE
ncbi:hypothetical protein ABK040_003165 [Willaertia magna]